MIRGLTPVQAAKAVLERIAEVEVNALLQVGLEVLQKDRNGLYVIKMGRHTFTAQSDRALEPGRGYWSDIRRTREGTLLLHRLHPKPALLQRKFPEFFDKEFLQSLSRQKDPAAAYKAEILQHLAHASSKEQFQSLTQLLLSLHQGVVTIPIKEEGRQALLQMRQDSKKERNEAFNQKSVKFYAGMNNIGPVEGEIRQVESQRHLRLRLYYPRSIAMLEEAAADLQGFKSVDIAPAEGEISPLWEGSTQTLLDIKG